MPEDDREIQWARELINIAEECLIRQQIVIEASQADGSLTKAALNLFHDCQELLAIQQNIMKLIESRRGKTLKDLRDEMELHENDRDHHKAQGV